MKKTSLKAIFSVLLAAVLFFGAVSPVFAAKQYDPEGHLTLIYVEGFESGRIYYPDDPDTSLLYPVDMNRLGAAFGNIAEYLKSALKKGDPRLVYHAVYDPLYECFGDTALKPDGVTMQDCVTVEPTVVEETEDGNSFVFRYDTRLDPVDLAHRLHDFIERVKREGVVTHTSYPSAVTDRIELVGSSFGTAVVMAYLNEYGDEGLDSVTLCVPAVGGVDFVGDLFTGNFYIDAEALKYFLSDKGILADYAPLIDILEKTGLLQMLLDVNVRPLLKVALRQSLHDLIHNIFGTFPAFWSFIDDEKYEAAKKNVFSAKDDKDVYKDFIEKIDYYHYNVQVKAREIMQRTIENGHPLNLICKYNTTLVPLSTQGNIMSDGMVTTVKASFGAVCAENKHYLPETYRQAALTDQVFLSPDRMIDASTCFLPANTWFIKDLAHGKKCTDYYDLLYHVAYDDINVFSDERWPQFLAFDGEDSLHPLQPLTEEQKAEEEKNNSFLSVLKRFLIWMADMIKGLFQKK